MVFESAGGPDRNRHYDPALEIALRRLGRAEATLTRIEVISNEAILLSASDRAFVPPEYKLPLKLARVEDYKHLRQKIGAGASQTAKRPIAKKSSSGNSQKRLRLFLTFKGVSPSAAGLVKVIRHETRYDSQSPLSLIAAEARTRKPASAEFGGQGFEQDSEVRLAVEQYAMVQAERCYHDWKAQRRDREKLGYDIELQRGRERLYVEVKGTRGAGERVILTHNEVRHAHKRAARSVLFVVAKIKVDKDKGGPVCSGGEVSVYERWDPEARKSLLTVKDYWYKLPGKATSRFEVE